MATRTAPLFTAAANARQIAILCIDKSGDLWSENIHVPVAATAANIEAIVAKYAAASQASVYGVIEYNIRTGDKDADNADNLDLRAAASQGINMLFKTVDGIADTIRLVSPVPATMQGAQDIPLASSTELSELIVAILAVKTGYLAQNVQFTGRRDRKANPRIKV